MAAGQKTLADLVQINNENLSGGVADELLEGVPLIRAMSSMPASNGTDHHWLRYDDAITANFRAVNTGRSITSTTDTLQTINCKIVDASTLCDAALADGYRFGRAAYVQREAMRALRTALATVERQVINGTAGSSFSDATGFAGFADDHASLGARTVSAGGSTNLTSVYVIRSADPMVTAALILGQDGNINVGNTIEQAVESADGLFYNGLWTPIHSWYAYQQGSSFSTYRLCNVDSAAAAGDTAAVDDDKLGEAIASFPTDRPATHIVYNRSSWRQHRNSRTATNATGSEAPFPTEAYGLPIVVTDQIANDETAVT